MPATNDASQARFTQVDPSGQEKNSYAYASCNPINGREPTGLECGGAIFGLATGAAGLIASRIGVVAGAPTVALGAVAAAGFAVSAGGVSYSVRDVVESCG